MAHFYDWLTVRFPYSSGHEINGGRVVYVNRSGQIDYQLDRRLKLVGSHESAIQVRTHGDTLEVSGNPTKFLSGHNLYGCNNLRMVCLLFAYGVWEKLGLEPLERDFARWFVGDVRISRVDVTRMYRPADAPPGWVPKWLSIASSVAHGGHQRVTNRGAYEGNTLYVGQHSRRVSLKLYDKAAELRRHPPQWPDGISKEGGEAWAASLLAYARDTLRVEVTLRTLELKDRHLDTVASWSPQVGEAILDERIRKLTMLEGLTMTDDELNDLPRNLRAPYRMWLAGDDLREVYSRRQFYRHRAALLPYGIDIAHVRPRQVVTERQHALGRPLRDFITGPGLEPPEETAEALLRMG